MSEDCTGKSDAWVAGGSLTGSAESFADGDEFMTGSDTKGSIGEFVDTGETMNSC